MADVTEDYKLAPHELVLLTHDHIDSLKRTLDGADVLDGGRVHAALPELRSQRLELGRLLTQLGVPGLEGATKPRPRRERWPPLSAV